MLGSIIYANTTAISKMNRLISAERLQRLIDAKDAAEVLKILAEISYGNGVTLENSYDFEKLLVEEMQELYVFIKTYCPSDDVKQAFVSKIDYQNIKAIVKAKFLKQNDVSFMSYDFGSIEVSELKDKIFSDSYGDFATDIKEMLLKIDAMYVNKQLTPAKIDIIVDKAMYKKISEIVKAAKDVELLNQYFESEIDLLNLQTVVRGKLYGFNSKDISDMLLIGGQISFEKLVSLIELSFDAFNEVFRFDKYKDIVKAYVEELNTGELAYKFEVLMDNYLLNLFRVKKYLPNGLDMFFSYIVAKLAEIKNVRLILVCKNNDIDKEKIKERLRQLYV